MKRFFIIGLIILSFFGFYSLVIKLSKPGFKERRNDAFCRAESRARNEEFFGVVTKKYRDEYNHQFKVLELTTKSSIREVQIFEMDFNNVYDKIDLGDSLSKELGSLELRVFRYGELKHYNFDFTCNNEKGIEL